MNRLYEEGSRSYVESWLDAEKLNEKLRGMLKWEKNRKKMLISLNKVFLMS